MDRVDQRYKQFCERFEQDASTDPATFMDDLEPVERSELAALIEHFLAAAPPRPWDSERFAGSPAEGAVGRAMSELGLDPGGVDAEPVDPWSAFLPGLRNKAEIKRETLVERLAGALGLPGSVERVRFYYHHMERGTLPAEGVSPRVLDKLGEILGVSPDRLRRSGAAQDPPPESEVAHVFARRVTGAVEHGALQARLTPDLSGDETVDRLFTGESEQGSESDDRT